MCEEVWGHVSYGRDREAIILTPQDDVSAAMLASVIADAAATPGNFPGIGLDTPHPRHQGVAELVRQDRHTQGATGVTR